MTERFYIVAMLCVTAIVLAGFAAIVWLELRKRGLAAQHDHWQELEARANKMSFDISKTAPLYELDALREDYSKLKHNISMRVDEVHDRLQKSEDAVDANNRAIENVTHEMAGHLARLDDKESKLSSMLASASRPGAMRGL